MADYIWDGDTAASLEDSSGPASSPGVSAGDGNIYIFADTVDLTDGDSITIQNCDTIFHGNGSNTPKWNLSGFCKLVIDGTSNRNITMTGEVAGASFDDWEFELTQTSTDALGSGPTVQAYSTVFQYCKGLTSLNPTAEAAGWSSMELYSCTLQHMGTNDSIAFGETGTELGPGSRLIVHQCRIIRTGNDGDSSAKAIKMQGLSGAALIGDVRRSTFYYVGTNTGGPTQVFRILEAGVDVANNIITLDNPDVTEVSVVASLGTGGTTTSLGGNFVHHYTDPLSVGGLTLLATDQNVDPLFFDDVEGAPFPGVDLRPDGSVGSPALWQADVGDTALDREDGVWHSGALEPHNLATLTTVDTAANTSVYADVKQRIYEDSFGLNATRGRGIRMKLRSTDRRSRKLFAGLWIRHAGEEPK
jgi:hypothetical protein